MNSTRIPAEISAFATSVRHALGDLPAQEVDDLTDGLEADLAQVYAGEHPRALPDPSAYAMELRTAAGLTVGAKAVKGLRAEAAGLARNARRSWDNTLQQSARRDQSPASSPNPLAW